MSVVKILALSAIVGSTSTLTEPPTPHPDTACPSRNVPIQGRKSPLDSLTFKVGGQPVKVCYGRPSARGRVMLGGKDVPYGKLWRTGANEPTVFFASVPLTVAGISVTPGRVLPLHCAWTERVGDHREPLGVSMGERRSVHRRGESAGARPGQGQERGGQRPRRDLHHSGRAERRECKPGARVGEDPSEDSVHGHQVVPQSPERRRSS
jgi:DUF2911 family protein